MLIHKETFSDERILDHSTILPLKKTLWLNIETTGLSPSSAFIFMIGYMVQTSHTTYEYTCLLAEHRRDEESIILHLADILKQCTHLITLGGARFTVPFVTERYSNYSDAPSLLFYGLHIQDITQQTIPFQKSLQLANLKKTTLEKLFAIQRRDALSGKQLIACYGDWELHHTSETRALLLLHQNDDMHSLLILTQLLSYNALFSEKKILVTDFEICPNTCIFHISLPIKVPFNILFQQDFLQLSFSGDYVELKIDYKKGRLKHFLEGPYKDYYYLPEEDQAIHSSVACFVDRSHRKKATASTCYVGIEGYFLPCKKNDSLPLFKEDYHSKKYYIQFDPVVWKEDLSLPIQYLKLIL